MNADSLNIFIQLSTILFSFIAGFPFIIYQLSTQSNIQKNLFRKYLKLPPPFFLFFIIYQILIILFLLYFKVYNQMLNPHLLMSVIGVTPVLTFVLINMLRNYYSFENLLRKIRREIKCDILSKFKLPDKLFLDLVELGVFSESQKEKIQVIESIGLICQLIVKNKKYKGSKLSAIHIGVEEILLSNERHNFYEILNSTLKLLEDEYETFKKLINDTSNIYHSDISTSDKLLKVIATISLKNIEGDGRLFSKIIIECLRLSCTLPTDGHSIFKISIEALNQNKSHIALIGLNCLSEISMREGQSDANIHSIRVYLIALISSFWNKNGNYRAISLNYWHSLRVDSEEIKLAHNWFYERNEQEIIHWLTMFQKSFAKFKQ